MSVLLAFICLCITYVQFPQRSEGAFLQMVCELPCGWLGLNLGSLEEQPVLLTTELPLKSPIDAILKDMCFFATKKCNLFSPELSVRDCLLYVKCRGVVLIQHDETREGKFKKTRAELKMYIEMEYTAPWQQVDSMRQGQKQSKMAQRTNSAKNCSN